MYITRYLITLNIYCAASYLMSNASGFLCKIINSDKIYLNIIVSNIKYDKKVNKILGIKICIFSRFSTFKKQFYQKCIVPTNFWQCQDSYVSCKYVQI